MNTLPHPALASSAVLFDAAKERAEQRAHRIAARRAFVEMKLTFVRAAAEIRGALGVRLQRRVRQAQDAADLLCLQQDLSDALPQGDTRAERLRQELAQQLERLFAPGGALPRVGSIA